MLERFRAALWLSIVALCIVLVIVFSIFTKYNADNRVDYQKEINNYMQAYAINGEFSGSILISKGNEILSANSYGMANYQLDVANAKNTVFTLASLTKSFTSIAIMQLEEKSMLNLNDPLTKYIANFPNGDKITILNLLSNTSGLPDIDQIDNCNIYKKSSHSPLEIIYSLMDKPCYFAPGEKFSNCNLNYIILGSIIEKVTNQSYEDYIINNIFKPLNMENSGFEHNEKIINNHASGYVYTTNSHINAEYVDMSVYFSSGNIYSTVQDLYLFNRALCSEKLLKKSTLDKIFTPCKDNYGLGFFVNATGNKKMVYNFGSIEGFSSFMYMNTTDDICITILSNISNAPNDKISTDLSNILFSN